jgi:hypothetical protein
LQQPVDPGPTFYRYVAMLITTRPTKREFIIGVIGALLIALISSVLGYMEAIPKGNLRQVTGTIKDPRLGKSIALEFNGGGITAYCIIIPCRKNLSKFDGKIVTVLADEREKIFEIKDGNEIYFTISDVERYRRGEVDRSLICVVILICCFVILPKKEKK